MLAPGKRGEGQGGEAGSGGPLGTVHAEVWPGSRGHGWRGLRARGAQWGGKMRPGPGSTSLEGDGVPWQEAGLQSRAQARRGLPRATLEGVSEGAAAQRSAVRGCWARILVWPQQGEAGLQRGAWPGSELLRAPRNIQSTPLWVPEGKLPPRQPDLSRCLSVSSGLSFAPHPTPHPDSASCLQNGSVFSTDLVLAPAAVRSEPSPTLRGGWAWPPEARNSSRPSPQNPLRGSSRGLLLRCGCLSVSRAGTS